MKKLILIAVFLVFPLSGHGAEYPNWSGVTLQYLKSLLENGAEDEAIRKYGESYFAITEKKKWEKVSANEFIRRKEEKLYGDRLFSLLENTDITPSYTMGAHTMFSEYDFSKNRFKVTFPDDIYGWEMVDDKGMVYGEDRIHYEAGRTARKYDRYFTKDIQRYGEYDRKGMPKDPKGASQLGAHAYIKAKNLVGCQLYFDLSEKDAFSFIESLSKNSKGGPVRAIYVEMKFEAQEATWNPSYYAVKRLEAHGHSYKTHHYSPGPILIGNMGVELFKWKSRKGFDGIEKSKGEYVATAYCE